MVPGAQAWRIQGGLVWAARLLPRAAEAFLVAAVYVAAARIGQVFAIPPGNVTPVWLPSGLFLAWALLRGPGIWPGVFVGALLGNVWAYLGHEVFESGIGPALVAGCANGLGDVLGIVGAAWLIHRLNGRAYPFQRGLDAIRFILFGVVVGPGVSAAFGVGALAGIGVVSPENAPLTLLTWWVGDAIGALVVAPVILALAREEARAVHRAAALELVLFTFVLVGAVVLLIYFHPLRSAHHSAAVMAVPVLLWAVFRLGQRVAFGAMFVVSAGGVLATALLGRGLPDVLLNREFIDLQLAVGLLISTSLVISAVLAEMGEMRGELRATRDGLSTIEIKRRFLAREVVEHKEAERRLARSLAYQKVYTDIQGLALVGETLEATLQRVLEMVVTVPFFALGGRGALFLADEDTETLTLVAHRNIGAGVLQACATLPYGTCLCGRAASARELLHHADVDDDHDIAFPDMQPHGHYTVPILSGDAVRGVLNVYLESGHRREEEEESFLRTVAGMVAGIIDRKRAQLDLADSERRYRDLVAGSVQGIAIHRDLKLLYFNESCGRMFGGDDWQAKALPASVEGFIAPHEMPRIVDLMRRRLRGEQVPDVYEVEGRRVDGSPICLMVSARVVDWEGAPAVQSTFLDITERKRAEQNLQESRAELARSNAELEQFAYAISHDLQEPLRMVSSYVGLIDRRYRGLLDDDGREFLGFAGEGASRMQAMIADLLSYSRVQTRGVELAPLDCEEPLSQALAALRIAISESGAEVGVDGVLPIVMGDGSQLARLFQNLIGNAVKYRHPDRAPLVRVGAEPGGRDGDWVFSVSDNGIGIPEADREKVFGVFQRLRAAEGYEGTGIGLALCRRIVERHGGRIWVEGDEAGSVFRFTLRSGDPGAAGEGT